jgi:hypothetical protein
MKQLAFLSLSYLAFACSGSSDSKLAQDVATVLGARLEVEGEPSRASADLGERVNLSWLSLSPASLQATGWAFSACIGQVGDDGSPICRQSPFASGQLPPTADAPRFRFQIPPKARVEAGDALLVTAAGCADAEPKPIALNGLEPDCSGQGEGIAVLAKFELGSAAANHHPSFDAAPLLRDGAPWTASASASACGDQGVDTVRAGAGPQPITVQVSPTSREGLDDAGTLEKLQVLHFASAGAFEQVTSVLDDDSTSVVATWQPPPAISVPSKGLVVRFGFVLQDGRGGADFAERSLCVRP